MSGVLSRQYSPGLLRSSRWSDDGGHGQVRRPPGRPSATLVQGLGEGRWIRCAAEAGTTSCDSRGRRPRVARAGPSVLVPVALVRSVTVAVVDVVDVVAVGDRLVPAPGTMLVGSVVGVLLM